MTEIYCHRGYSGRYPENTMLAFEKSIGLGADGIELDVQLTRDGQVVIFHDERLERVTGKAAFVKDLTLRELRELDASGPFRGKVPVQRIPTLREYFQLIAPTNLKTNIELKTGMFEYPGLERQVWDIVKEFRQQERVCFSSFHCQSLLRVKELAPEAPCGLLRQNRMPRAGQVVRELGLEAYHPFYLQLTEPILRELREQGRIVRAYTPNHTLALGYLLRKNIGAVITNFPERAVRLRAGIQGKPS